ncbi:MAG: hypothetical protein B7Z73_13230 [Planctomycetia bacterium 21-64-5]|nr:MAG: hypothetical protein B7Z73_13230 [Planctomycetia bacterium 21-64-5]
MQFSVRSLCVALTLVCVSLAWQVAGAHRARAGVELAKSLHAHFWFDEDCALSLGPNGYNIKNNPPPRGPRWLRKTIGDEYFRRIVVLSFVWRPITDDDLERIVAVMPELWALSLEKPEVTNAGMVHLRRLRQLRQLSLTRAKIDSDGLANLEALSELRWLELDLTNVGDDGLKHLRHLPALTTLSLQLTGITDAGLIELTKLPALDNFLDLNGTEVTDAGVETLKQLRRLRRLELGRTKVTAEGIRKLREALPETDITQRETHGYENRNQTLRRSRRAASLRGRQ